MADVVIDTFINNKSIAQSIAQYRGDFREHIDKRLNYLRDYIAQEYELYQSRLPEFSSKTSVVQWHIEQLDKILAIEENNHDSDS